MTKNKSLKAVVRTVEKKGFRVRKKRLEDIGGKTDKGSFFFNIFD